jgi:integrase
MFQLAMEWAVVDKLLPKIKLLPGEVKRERVLTSDEEHRYLDAAQRVGDDFVAVYERAQRGIRAKQRGQKPTPPRDPYILRDIATVLLDCGIRPEECFRLRREFVVDGALMVPFGKTDRARRRIPLDERVRAVIDSRLQQHDYEWVFPVPTQSGHAEPSTVRDHHDKAIEYAAVEPFMLYDLRHTCLTRWAEYMDPYTLAYLAGHSSFATTKRYVHPQKETVRAAMERARTARSGHKTGHSTQKLKAQKSA